MDSVSIYFPAGDFVDVMQRYDEGREQVYQTHNEVARLIYDFLGSNRRVNIYSFVTSNHRTDTPAAGLRIFSLGAKNYAAANLLRAAILKDDADQIIVHFPNIELLRIAQKKKARVCAILAGSFNRTSMRTTLTRWRTISLLNNPKVELVSNHCQPSTEHLARLGVRREKLIAWDICHPFDPSFFKPKTLSNRTPFETFYAGSISEDKGVAELIHSIALLRGSGIEVHCSLAGNGEIERMQNLGARLNVSDLLSFMGLVGNNKVFSLMTAADIVVVPSRTVHTEGFPLAMFEAIASRTPIVCSNHPMFRDIMMEGRNASVFPSGDCEGFAAAIRRTLTDPILYATLSANAPLTWAALKGPADWRTLIFKWVTEGLSSAWIQDRMLGSN